MAKRKDTDAIGSSATPEPQVTPEIPAIPVIAASAAPAIAAAKAELPIVDSPSISPADLVKTGDSDLEPAAKPIPELAVEAPAPVDEKSCSPNDGALYLNLPRIALRPRHKRYALLAASVAVAAVLGGIVGTLASGGFSTSPVPVAAHDDSKAMQQTVARLTKEIGTLKASLDDANKFAHAQVAKLDAKIDTKIGSKPDVMKDSAEITGSISAPQTVMVATPLPTPRPAPRVAAAESQQPARLAVVPGWSIRDARGGYIYVESNGDIYQIVPGAPLPGLGPVESVKRQDGRWVVTTPKGIIVSMRDRRYFE
jgi:hypothetical protein